MRIVWRDFHKFQTISHREGHLSMGFYSKIGESIGIYDVDIKRIICSAFFQ